MRKMVFVISLSLLFFSVGAAELWGQEAFPLGLPALAYPADNPQMPEKIALGKQLFEDKRFSADGTVSCATCHDPAKAFTDGLPVAEGIQKRKGTRNSPTVINAAYYETQFWDGRRPSLEEQAKDPFVNSVEHGLGETHDFHQFIVDIVQKDAVYPGIFQQVFGVTADQITIDHVVKAIASFERTVLAADSPFDRYQYGGDEKALSDAARRGLTLYRGKARCQDCHAISENYALFTDNKFHNLGVGFGQIQPRLRELIKNFRMAQLEGRDLDESILTNAEISELGRFAITQNLQELGAFKTPSLRNIAVTGPYMHDGSIETLEEVMDLYNRGGEKNPFLASGIRPLNLTDDEIGDVIAFLKSLTSPEYMSLVKH